MTKPPEQVSADRLSGVGPFDRSLTDLPEDAEMILAAVEVGDAIGGKMRRS
jgi:hypothetical protein